MAIVGHAAPVFHPGPARHSMVFDLLHAVASPMAAYFTALGGAAGLLSGWFRIKLRSKNQELEAALVEKESLLRVLTHDLANSIGASQTFLKYGVEGAGANLPAESREDLDAASKALAQARELMGFARTLLALESGKLHIQPIECDVGLLVQESIGLFRQQCAAKQLTIEVRAEGGPHHALAEPVVFKNSVLNNLLSNAMKFSQPGERIDVKIAAEEKWLSVSVVNAGPVISPEKIATLFSPTGRTTTPGTAGERGTGFGLPLASRFCRMMGGELSLTSQKAQQGDLARNTFRVRLPAATGRLEPGEEAVQAA
ncbi:MAG: HAMP domain-containing histidine kinase [Deltaproteobacteria bacterium]|nr:HAMP domain-containing histidine kinase [Deltaproteobacteria bacterium]